MSECTHDCSSCGQSCSDRKEEQQSFRAELNAMSKVKKVIGVVSGKGGVGKSLVTALLASQMQKEGFRSAVLDADITGPSIPAMFGVTERASGSEFGIMPAISRGGSALMSINLLLENTTDPVIWRGPVIGGTVKQFWTDVVWGDIDVMFVDMPPGTGDVPLTVFQSLPVDGIVVVTSPQELVSMIVGKAVKMAQMMDIPILGVVENMSYIRCGKCGETETRTIKAQGHKQGELVKHQNATCTKDGGDYYKCLTCGETYFVLGFAKNGHWFLGGECVECGIAESDVPFDIDLDCAVSATDLTYLKRILLSNKTAECDPNGDGKLNILDLIILKKRLAKK